ncbi:MAG: LPS export ABC transporter periplasmic protein LptC [Paludibacteraceae bacterium]|nr:LPS export ABC transporter periplasmic protein LptC [Paludibacteraceae bacterium]
MHKAIALWAVALCFLCSLSSACSSEAPAEYDSTAPARPTMRALEVSTVVSDSGVTRYRATTPEWLIFNSVKEPYWDFPSGVHLEQFDTHMKTEANIDCDKAYYNVNLKLWQLDGNVKVTNRKGERFETDQLFWDQSNQKVYSEKEIHIRRDNCILKGLGFEGDETMSKYTIKKPTGIIPVHED